MTNSVQTGFLLPHGMNQGRLIRLLGGDNACQAGETDSFRLRFSDSFDWRLFNAGLVLLQLETPQGTMLRLKCASDDEPVDSVLYDAEPGWPADLPTGGLRDRVAEALDMRVLLPVAEVAGLASELRLLNEDDKTVVRLQLLEMTSTSADVDEPRSLWPRLRLLPVKGYDEELERIACFFADEQEWPQAPACLLDEAMTAVGREPGDYSSKFSVALRPGMMAIDALRKVFLSLLDTLERNVDGTRANLDSEFLHDLRVATRRTRSALAQVKRVLPDGVVEDFKPRFAWLGEITGPTRDLDVFLLELPKYRASLPAAMRADLDPLQERIEQAHVVAQRELAAALDSETFRDLLRDWRGVLEADDMPGEPGWFADLPIQQVVSKRIWRMYKRVRKDGRIAARHGEAEAMHELRKDCKKLRYLIEFFRSLYDPAMLKGVVKALKSLLDILGEFQDKEVQALHLRDLAADFDLADPHARSAVMAIGALAADSLRDQQRAHDRFAEAFATFDSADNHARYKALFNAAENE